MDPNPKSPHCPILPYPIQGHINPLLQFSQKGISITLTLPHRLLATTPAAGVSIEPISDGYDDAVNPKFEVKTYTSIFQRAGAESLTRLLHKLRESGRAVDFIVYDPFLPWAVGAAKEMGILAAAFFTQSCGVNAIYYEVFRGEIPVPVTADGIRVPGLIELEIDDLPTFVKDQENHL